MSQSMDTSSNLVHTPTKPSSKHTTPHSTPSKQGLRVTMPGVPWSQQGTLQHENPNLLADNPAMLSMSMLNGSEASPLSLWDGEADDMTMELLTDVDEGNVDEEVSNDISYLIYTLS